MAQQSYAAVTSPSQGSANDLLSFPTSWFYCIYMEQPPVGLRTKSFLAQEQGRDSEPGLTSTEGVRIRQDEMY